MENLTSYTDYSYADYPNFQGVFPTSLSPLKQKRARVYDQNDEDLDSIISKHFKKSEEPLIENRNHLASEIFEKNIDFEFLPRQAPEVRHQISILMKLNQYLASSENQKFKIDKFINEICTKFISNEDKQIELGILFYYIASQKEIPFGLGLRESRINEIELEIKNLKHIHKISCPEDIQNQLPSGCTAYILRPLVRMIFPCNGSFNIGGCKAVLNLMNSRLALYMTEEGRQQIIKTLKRLMIDPQFQNFFMDPFEVKEEFQQIILCDMKEPKDGPFSFIYVRWAMLMVLFNPISQYDEPNCYAVASLSNLINNQVSCNVLLKVLKNTLISGNISIEDLEIPAMPVFKTRLIYEEDFKLKLPYKDLEKLTSFSVVKECLKPLEPGVHSDRDAVTIHNSMKIEFGNDIENAKQVFFSFKRVLLQQLMLSIIQFYALNSLRPSSLIKIDEYSLQEGSKGLLLNLIIDEVDKLTTNLSVENLAQFNHYKVKLFSELAKVLFFVDYKNSEIKTKKNRVEFEHHDKGLLKKKGADYKNFKSERRLFILENDDLVPIDTLSKFQSYIFEISKKISDSNHWAKLSWINTSLKSITSNDFRQKIAGIVWELNKKESKLTADDYFESDSFFLIQDGGYTDFLSYHELFESLYD
nr:hypothetical protein [Parachlamydiaceae bacterium]